MIQPWNNPYTTLPYQQQVMPTTMQYQPAYQPQQQNNIIKVNGPSSALQYPTPPNTQSPPLFDTKGGQFYVVTADGAGSKTIETFDFMPHVEETKDEFDMSGLVTREEFQSFVNKVEQMIGAGNGIHGSVQAMPTQSTPATVNPQPVQPVATGQTDRRG